MMVSQNGHRRPKFPLGILLATPGVINSVSPAEAMQALIRHEQGDWGDLDAEDKAANDEALEHGGRLLSAYVTVDDVRFWIITEADRSATTLLLPEEY